MSLLPPRLKETLPPEQVTDAFLTLRQADAALVINSRCGIRPVARVRHELMWLLRELTHLSLFDIGALIGGRDATTVRSGIDQVCDRIAADGEYRREMAFQRLAVLSAARPGMTPGMTPSLCLAAIRGVLSDASLSDADARTAALQMTGGAHG
jgi:hypothetical protein